MRRSSTSRRVLVLVRVGSSLRACACRELTKQAQLHARRKIATEMTMQATVGVLREVCPLLLPNVLFSSGMCIVRSVEIVFESGKGLRSRVVLGVAGDFNMSTVAMHLLWGHCRFARQG